MLRCSKDLRRLEQGAIICNGYEKTGYIYFLKIGDDQWASCNKDGICEYVAYMFKSEDIFFPVYRVS